MPTGISSSQWSVVGECGQQAHWNKQHIRIQQTGYKHNSWRAEQVEQVARRICALSWWFSRANWKKYSTSWSDLWVSPVSGKRLDWGHSHPIHYDYVIADLVIAICLLILCISIWTAFVVKLLPKTFYSIVFCLNGKRPEEKSKTKIQLCRKYLVLIKLLQTETTALIIKVEI